MYKILLLVFVILNIAANSENRDLEILSESLKKYGEIDIDSCGYKIIYEVKTSYRNSTNQSRQIIEILKKGTKTKINCAEYKLYSDSLISFIVYPIKKEVYLIKNKKPQYLNIENIIKNTDSIFKSSELKNYYIKENYIYITLLMNKDINPPYNGSQVQYKINTKNKEIVNVTIDFANEDFPIKNMEMNFTLQETVYYDDFFDLPIFKNIFDDNGQFIPEYKDYKLITK